VETTDHTPINAVLTALVNGVVEALTQAVIAKLPYNQLVQAGAVMERFDKRLAAIEDKLSLSETVPSTGLEARLKTIEDNVANCAQTDDLPDMDEYVKTDDLQSAVEENLPDLDEYVKTDDLDDAVREVINEEVNPDDFVKGEDLETEVTKAVRATLENVRLTLND
jgi:hypothetical protein